MPTRARLLLRSFFFGLANTNASTRQTITPLANTGGATKKNSQTTEVLPGGASAITMTLSTFPRIEFARSPKQVALMQRLA